MAKIVRLGQDSPRREGIEAGSSDTAQTQAAVAQTDNWPAIISATVAIIVAGWVFSDRMEEKIEKSADRMQGKMENATSPVKESLDSLHNRFVEFEKAYAQDRINHLEEHHINASGD